MVAGTRTFSFEETLLQPPALEPPPLRHALFFFLIALTCALHFGTEGWGDFVTDPEATCAATAREMASTNEWLIPTLNGSARLHQAPLFYWLVIASLKTIGTSVAAIRLPGAAAAVLLVTVTFLIGERVAGYWRGFAAGLIYLCSVGTFFWGRLVLPDSLFAAFVSGAIYCALRGYQDRPGRERWFSGFWLCAALACLTKNLLGLIYPFIILFSAALFFREARLRFRTLFRWPHVLFFLGLVVPWHVYVEWRFPGLALNFPWPQNHSRSAFLLLHFVWWFPWSFILLPGTIIVWRKIVRPNEIEFSDCLFLSWVTLPLLFGWVIGAEHSAPIVGLIGFALWASMAWQRMPFPFRATGLAWVFLLSATTALWLLSSPQIPELVRTLSARVVELPSSVWPVYRQALLITSASLSVFLGAALFLLYKDRARLAFIIVAFGVVPMGLCLVNAASHTRTHSSLTDVAKYLDSHLGANGELLYEGSLPSASSLIFFLNRRIFLLEAPEAIPEYSFLRERYLTEETAMQKWSGAHAVYLVIDRKRIPFWQARLTERFHLYHQVSSSGTHVVLSNHP